MTMRASSLAMIPACRSTTPLLIKPAQEFDLAHRQRLFVGVNGYKKGGHRENPGTPTVLVHNSCQTAKTASHFRVSVTTPFCVCISKFFLQFGHCGRVDVNPLRLLTSA
jgi:hypothetical protein